MNKYYKIAVYAICGNEFHNVEDGLKSMNEADYICVLDTGSTDGSYEALLEAQKTNPKIILARKIYNPWRFDIPRNDSLAMVPTDADICICTDLDERLTPTWADHLRAVGEDDMNRVSYLYAWSHNDDGSPARVFGYDKVHDNRGTYKWHYPVHETLCSLVPITQKYGEVDNHFIMLHHYPIYKEGRSDYFSLLKLRAQEDPDDLFGLIYLSNEYVHRPDLKEEAVAFIENTIKRLKETQCNLDFLGVLYQNIGMIEENKDLKEFYFLKSIDATPGLLDMYIQCGRFYGQNHEPEKGIDIINKGLKAAHRTFLGYERDATGTSDPGDLLSLLYGDLGKKEISLAYAQLAGYKNSSDQRLQENVATIQRAL